MAREFARAFYNSTEWKKARAAYYKRVGGLCEVCASKGIVKPGEIVHHKEHISPDNIQDPKILLCFDNLQLVCRDCHAQLHETKQKRYYIDDTGRVVCRED